VPGATAIGAAFGAIESLAENLAVEVGPAGVRSVCLRTTANTDSRTIQQTVETLARKMNVPADQMMAGMATLNFLKVPATTSDTAKASVLIASDRAGLLTGTVVNSTAGAAAD
jgi:NAD(P)-dependent dehydrogenase (short-subunit alcohol dehydrogenase family)